MFRAAISTASLTGEPARLGTRRVPDDELRAVTRAAVSTFLHAFAAELAEPGG